MFAKLFHRPTTKSIPRKPGNRDGLAVTELAIGLPVLLTVMFGTMEVCTMIRTQQKLKIIAYEAARIGVLPGAGAINVGAQCNLLVNQYKLQSVNFTMTPADPTTLQSGDWFEVRIKADSRRNSLTGWTFGSSEFNETMTLRKP